MQQGYGAITNGGNAALELNGFNLNSANTYTGNTVINGGTLPINGAGLNNANPNFANGRIILYSDQVQIPTAQTNAGNIGGQIPIVGSGLVANQSSLSSANGTSTFGGHLRPSRG